MLIKCMTPTCGTCKKLGVTLNQLGIDYMDVDVSEDEEFREIHEVTSVPTLIREDGKKLIGMHTSLEIKEFLGIK